MIVDLRTDTVEIGRLKDFLTLYAREGLPLQREHLGESMGYYTTEVGNLAEVVHMWHIHRHGRPRAPPHRDGDRPALDRLPRPQHRAGRVDRAAEFRLDED